MAKNSALNNSLLYGLGSLVKACASFFLLPLYTSILGAEQYGQLSILQTASIVISTVITMALERSLYRLYHDYKTEEGKINFLSSVFVSINFIGLIVVILFIFFGRNLTPYLGGVDFMSGLLPVVLYSYVNANINYHQIILQTRQEGGKYVFISLLFVAIYNALCIILLCFFSPTYQSMVLATLITTLIVLPISLFMVREQLRCYFNWKILKNVLSFTSPILAMVLFSWLLHFSDRLFLANLTRLEDVGLYSFAAKIVSLVPLFCGAIFQSYVPYFYDITNNVPYKDAKLKLKPINDTIIFIICMLCLLLVFLYNLILHTFFSSEFYDSVNIFYLLVIGALVGQQTGLLSNMLLQNKKSGRLALITISAGLLSLVFNLLLISYIGRIGAAISNLCVSFLMVAATLLIAKREYYVPFNYYLLIGGLFAICLMYLADLICGSIYFQALLKFVVIAAYVLVVIKANMLDINVLKSASVSVICKVKKISSFKIYL